MSQAGFDDGDGSIKRRSGQTQHQSAPGLFADKEHWHLSWPEGNAALICKSALNNMGRGIVMADDVPIRCADVLVKPGNLIFADSDGIAVVPREIEELVFVKAQEKARKENLSRKKLLDGKSLREVDLKYGVL
jgi:hypothetical protein